MNKKPDSRSYTGKFIRCIYKNNEGFVIAVFFDEDKGEELIAKGTVIPFVLQQPMEIKGVLENHSRYGEQLRIDSYQTIQPKDKDAIFAYLSSGMIKGVGKKTAEAIVAHFGEASLDIIMNSPDKLLDIPKIGKKTVKTISEGLKDHQDEQEIMLFLMGHGISSLKASRIYKTFGRDTVGKIQQNPYCLADIQGISFPMADAIAKSLGWEEDNPKRLEAGFLYFLTKNCYESGHAYLPKKQIIQVCTFSLEVEEELIEKTLVDLVIKDRIVNDNNSIYLRHLYDTEMAIASAVCQENSNLYHYENFYTTILHIEKESNIELTAQQRNAIWTALNAKISVITGSPGVGKTLTIKFLLRMLKDYGKKPVCAAPTGRAAKRITELTGFPAYTIHRLLGLRISDKDDEEENSIIIDAFPTEEYKRSDVLIIDEASMIDMPLMKSVLDNLGDRQLLLVGDVDQLPSVGPGKIFKDIIDSQVADIVVLNEVFRQAHESGIVQNALKINKGEMPSLEGANNFEFQGLKNDSEAVDFIVNFLQNDAYVMGYDALKDVQILTPMKRGKCGVHELNSLIQEKINPVWNPNEQLLLKNGVKYRKGDKVMQTVNNYEKEVFNGEWGFILDIDFPNKTLTIDFQDKIIDYDFSEIGEITHAYAITIHKSQGSEFKCVILPMTKSHYVMLQRNLLYTGVTRASDMLYLIGQKQAIKMAVENNKPIQRNTKLKERIIAAKKSCKKK